MPLTTWRILLYRSDDEIPSVVPVEPLEDLRYMTRLSAIFCVLLTALAVGGIGLASAARKYSRTGSSEPTGP